MTQTTLLLYQWLAQGTLIAFVFALGACVGSFLNVVAWRLPRGENIVSPPSACPKCHTTLKWYDNVPLLGWVLLRGKCRYCHTPISPQYVLMELAVALLFTSLWVLWGTDERALATLGIHPGDWRPEWAHAGMTLMWPMFALAITLVGALVVSTLIDARTFTIPAVIPWIVMAAALIVHPIHAVFVARAGGLTASPFVWTVPATEGGFGWMFALAGVGGLAGLAAANLLLRLGIIPLSFTDFEAWEREAAAAHEAAKAAADARGEPLAEPAGEALGPVLLRTLLLTGPAVAGMFLGTITLAPAGRAPLGIALGGAAGLVIGAFLRRLATTSDPPQPGAGEPIWTQYPHARREVLKECLFLAPVALGMLVGVWIGVGRTAPVEQDPVTGALLSLAPAPPLWLLALGASAMGALVGGGVVWVVRILGSLLFGKEAMGLGDVHLMAAVGAVLGWVDPVLAFFVAPFSGICWALLGPLLGRLVRLPSVLPYGPHLAAATLAILYARPLAEGLLSVVFQRPINLP